MKLNISVTVSVGDVKLFRRGQTDIYLDSSHIKPEFFFQDCQMFLMRFGICLKYAWNNLRLRIDINPCSRFHVIQHVKDSYLFSDLYKKLMH
jgi:hypothetical protein